MDENDTTKSGATDGARSLHPLVSPHHCKCVRGIGLMGAELGIVADCPIHGERSGYNPPEYTYDSDNAD